jgi:hypothetical protein
MKSLPNDHTPKKDSWEKILGKMSFDSQLEGHIPNFPMFEPNEKSWAGITEKLDEKKKVVRWPYFSLAAALIGGILIATVIFNSEHLITENISVQNELTTIEDFKIPIEIIKPEIESPKKSINSEVKISKTAKLQKPDVEVPLASIEVPELELIAIESERIIPEKMNPTFDSAPQSDPKTLHEVTISWGLKPNNFQVKTSFGKQDPSSLGTVHIGSISKSKRIRIGQKN